jgi:thiamine biosynthesis protein ThiS
MRITVNGELREVPDAWSVSALLAELGLDGPGIAVEHNLRVLRRADWESTALAEDDRLEIVHFVGGG